MQAGAAWLIPAAMLFIPTLAILAWWLWPPSAEVRELDEGQGQVAAEASVAAQPTRASASEALAAHALPPYALTTEGGLPPASDLTPPGEHASGPMRHRYHLDTAFDWKLEPRGEVEGPLELRAFVFPEAPTIGEARALELGELAHVEGAVARVHGSIAGLSLAPGTYTLALVLGRPGSLPTQATEVHAAESTDAWIIRRLAIEIE